MEYRILGAYLPTFIPFIQTIMYSVAQARKLKAILDYVIFPHSLI